jgi:DNA-binding HxlR family transcriptional regulator
MDLGWTLFRPGVPWAAARARAEVASQHLVEPAQLVDERLRSIVECIGRRWVSVVLIAGYQGARRLSEYRRLAVGISDRILTLRLHELEKHGLIEREVVPTMPVQISYTPTERGCDLVRALQPLSAWVCWRKVICHSQLTPTDRSDRVQTQSTTRVAHAGFKAAGQWR